MRVCIYINNGVYISSMKSVSEGSIVLQSLCCKSSFIATVYNVSYIAS